MVTGQTCGRNVFCGRTSTSKTPRVENDRGVFTEQNADLGDGSEADRKQAVGDGLERSSGASRAGLSQPWRVFAIYSIAENR